MNYDIADNHYSDDHADRVKDTGEVFTPEWLAIKMLDTLDVDWNNPPQDKTFLDPTCGSGNLLVTLAKRGIPVEMLYGVDLMEDNVETTKRRLREIFGDTDSVNKTLDHNIRCEDALVYDYSFSSEPQGASALF